MEKSTDSELPIVNCHTHIFTGDHVPPWLAKTYLFWPAYLLLHLGFIVAIIKSWIQISNIRYSDRNKRFQKLRLGVNFFLYRLGFLYQLIGWFFTIQAFFIVYDWLKTTISPNNGIDAVESIRAFLIKHSILHVGISPYIDTTFVIFILFFFKWGRNFIVFLFKKFWNFLAFLPGKQTIELLNRYLYIARFSSYKTETRVFGKLRDQYPSGTAFIVLPMDMEFMGAGKVKCQYLRQMVELAKIKRDHPQIFYPFVFVDPRRVAKENKASKESKRPRLDKPFFDYDLDKNGKQVLKDCFVKKFIERRKFSGFKIYPALGYYPFDEQLLPVWKYAADNQLPITSHCIRGTIFYRGRKQKAWNQHSVFEQTFEGAVEPLALPQLENEKFQLNFTHPLNYLCLLKEELLRRVVAKASSETRQLFGYTDEKTPLKHDLAKLKLCLAHFGGDDQWKLFLERDRDNFSSELLEHPDRGIEFFVNRKTNQPIPGKIEQVWKFADWYSIICSLMLQYDNVYSDISYIVHNNDIQPLLKDTLRNKKLSERVLFGTDFYVVRNHKSERNMLVDCLAGLSDQEIDLIARKNPRTFLCNHVHGPLSMGFI